MVFMLLTMSVLYHLVHFSDFSSVAIIVVSIFHGGKNVNYAYNPFRNFVHFLPFLLGFVAEIWSQHSPRKLLVVSLVHTTLACCFPIFWLQSRSLTHLLKTSVVISVFDHAEWIKMTSVFSAFLSLTKCYSEFEFFQANYPNPCHCLQQMSSEAVLTPLLIFGNLIEMMSSQILLNFLFPCSFFHLITYCFPSRS